MANTEKFDFQDGNERICDNERVCDKYEAGWLEAEGKISDLNEKLKNTESQCEALRQAVCDAMTQLRWLNEKEQRGSTNTILARLETTLNECKH